MPQGKQPHILNAASNLLGICFVLITGLKLTRTSETTLADEISLFAALGLLGSCVLSYISLRSVKNTDRLEKIADYLFLVSLVLLFAAIVLFSLGYV
jgi:hypothetical protein